MSQHYILAIDHGTSGIKSSIVSTMGVIVDTESLDTPIEYLPGGGAEQDPELWWQAVLSTGRMLVERGAVPRDAIKAVSVSSTFSTTVVVDASGEALMNAITWMDSRGARYIQDKLKGFPSFEGYGIAKALKWIKRTGGAPTLSGKDDIAHMLLVQNEYPEIYQRAHKFLPSKDFFNLKLSGEFAASYDSITLFWVTNNQDINDIHYDDELIDLLGIDRHKLPELRPATALLGTLKPEVAILLGLSESVQVAMGTPDHQAAGIGAGAVDDFVGHLYIGTSSWLQCTVPFKKTDVLHSIASLPTAIPGKYYCANEQDLAGGCLSFLMDNLLFPQNSLNTMPPPNGSYELLDAIAAEIPAGSGKLIFTPWLNGERTPVDDHTVRGGLYNLSKTSDQNHVIRAVMEGVAYNTRWSLKYVERFIKRPMPYINIVGGGALSDIWCQIFADVLNREIRRVKDPRQANARGAAMVAAVALGELRFDQVSALIEIEAVFKPQAENRKIYDMLYREFIQVYKNNKAMYKRLNAVESGAP